MFLKYRFKKDADKTNNEKIFFKLKFFAALSSKYRFQYEVAKHLNLKFQKPRPKFWPA